MAVLKVIRLFVDQELASDTRRDLARSLGPAFRLALTDKVPGVYLAGLSLLRASTQPGVVAPRECANLAADLAPLLIEKVLPDLTHRLFFLQRI